MGLLSDWRRKIVPVRGPHNCAQFSSWSGQKAGFMKGPFGRCFAIRGLSDAGQNNKSPFNSNKSVSL